MKFFLLLVHYNQNNDIKHTKSIIIKNSLNEIINLTEVQIMFSFCLFLLHECNEYNEHTSQLIHTHRTYLIVIVWCSTQYKRFFCTFSCRHITKNCLMVFFGPRWEHFSCIHFNSTEWHLYPSKKDRLQMIVATYFVSKSSSYPSIELNIIIWRKKNGL